MLRAGLCGPHGLPLLSALGGGSAVRAYMEKPAHDPRPDSAQAPRPEPPTSQPSDPPAEIAASDQPQGSPVDSGSRLARYIAARKARGE